MTEPSINIERVIAYTEELRNAGYLGNPVTVFCFHALTKEGGEIDILLAEVSFLHAQVTAAEGLAEVAANILIGMETAVSAGNTAGAYRRHVFSEMGRLYGALAAWKQAQGSEVAA